MRTLISFPIIHTEHDMGSLLGQLKQQYVARYGHEKWVEHLEWIEASWKEIHRMITELNLPYGSVRLYQDGLPECGRESDIVREVAARGSRNYQLLAELMERGARLMGTEDPQLLLEEYQTLREELRGQQNPDQETRRREHSQALLRERDRFIALRINSTLRTGETGLLFLGMAHSLEPLLDADILVRRMLPPRPGSRERAVT